MFAFPPNTVLSSAYASNSHNPRQDVNTGESQYLAATGTATNTSDQTVEVVVIMREHWEKCSGPKDSHTEGDKEDSKEAPKSFFLTEVDIANHENGKPPELGTISRQPSVAHSIARYAYCFT